MVYIFYKNHICFFLICVKRNKHTPPIEYVWRHKDFKAQSEATLQLAYHGCKNLTRTSKTPHVKHPNGCNC